jgi:tRNA A37 threonylcarbamoyladenosine dehydratase
MNSHVLIVGLGGVGGICAEMIVRSGVGEMTIVDADTVDASNRNRQIPALKSTEGKDKTEVMAQRLLDINPELKLNVKNIFLKDNLVDELLTSTKFDFACDCIDTLSSKVHFIRKLMHYKIPFISSMGAGGKMNPETITIVDISETYNDNLARYVRKRLQKFGIKSGFPCVFSPEQADKSKIIVSEKAKPKKSIIGTISYMPTIFGCFCASYVIRGILK